MCSRLEAGPDLTEAFQIAGPGNDIVHAGSVEAACDMAIDEPEATPRGRACQFAV